jgi:glycosyltransferase involved in cell wall biosynthesis
MHPKISILLPVYNGGPFLEPCLASVFQQTENDFELIVSDDGSQDDSLQIVQSFSDPRLRIIKGPGRGLFANLNNLLQSAEAPLVRILCQDDRLQARCLERELKFHHSHPLAPITICKANRVNAEGTVISTPSLNDLPDILSPDLSQQHFFYHGCIAGNLSTVCFKKRLIGRYGLFDESFTVSGDYEYWARITENEFLGIIQEPLVDLRVHPAQLSRATKSLPSFVHENRRIRKKILRHLPAEIRPLARWFECCRHDVLDLHSGMRALLDGRFSIAAAILASFAPIRFLAALVAWVATGNNRFYRPQAPWALSCAWAPNRKKSNVERSLAA